jgi:hypothetical protein
MYMPVSGLDDFFDGYRAAFVRYDSEALVALFEFPLHLISATDKNTLISVATQDGWRRTLDGVLDAYRSLGVADAVPLDFEVVELTSDVCSVRMRWDLRDDDGNAIYDFKAVYSVVKVATAWRIAGIIHDEVPKLQAATRR